MKYSKLLQPSACPTVDVTWVFIFLRRWPPVVFGNRVCFKYTAPLSVHPLLRTFMLSYHIQHLMILMNHAPNFILRQKSRCHNVTNIPKTFSTIPGYSDKRKFEMKSAISINVAQFTGMIPSFDINIYTWGRSPVSG